MHLTWFCAYMHRVAFMHSADVVFDVSELLSGLSGSGPAPPLPVPVSSGLRGSSGLPAPAVCHRVRGAEAHRPG